MTDLNTRSQILAAAEIRFSQYGYNKTAMAEIAGDCNMSAANLYRHFKNKLDIGAALAEQCLAEKETGMAVIVANNQLCSVEKLNAFVLYILHDTYHHLDENPRLSELIEAIMVQRPDVVQKHSESRQALLRQLLEQSKQSGEFSFTDLEETTDAINTSITLFNLPTVMPMFSLEELENKVNVLCKLLLNGLTPR